MIRTLTAMLAAALAAPAPAQPANTAATTAIGIVEAPEGRPTRHTITIVSAFSCPYCRVLDQQGMQELRTKWRPMGLSIETVPFVLSPTDVPASIASTCGPVAGYARRSTILFRAQPDLLGNWNAAAEDAKKRAAAIPRGGGALAIARLSGLITLAPSLGLRPEQLVACLSDPARQRGPGQRQRAADARWKIVGTPTVLIDGKKVSGTWTEIRRVLVATMAG